MSRVKNLQIKEETDGSLKAREFRTATPSPEAFI